MLKICEIIQNNFQKIAAEISAYLLCQLYKVLVL